MILGKRTLDETRDLLAVADYRFSETGKAYNALKVKPQDITNDWIILSDKWKKDSREIAGNLVLAQAKWFPITAANIPTDDDYQRIIKYVQYQEQDPKSLQGITRRIERVSGQPILYPKQPKQVLTDVDLDLFKKLDASTKAAEAAAEEAKKKAGETAKNNWPWIVGGTIVGTVGLMVAAKVYLK